MVTLNVHWPDELNWGSDPGEGILEYFDKLGFVTLTLLFVALPGIFHCFVDAATRYVIEDAGKEEKAYPTIEINYGSFRYFPRWALVIVNLLHLRLLYEFTISLRLCRVTGGFLDALGAKAVFQSFPQAVVQSLIWYYLSFNNMEELWLLTSVGASFVCICVTPTLTPCFEEQYRRKPIGLDDDASGDREVTFAEHEEYPMDNLDHKHDYGRGS